MNSYGVTDLRNYQDSLDNGALAVGGNAGLFDLVRDFFGGLWNDITGASQQQREYEMQNQLLDKQNSFTQRMWLENNRYNHPASQVERMISAGLNPNLVNQANTSSQVSSSSAPSVNSAIGGVRDAMQFLGDTVMNGIRQKFDIDRIKKQNEADDANIDYTKAMADSVKIDNSFKPREYRWFFKKYSSEIYKNLHSGNVDKEQAAILRSDAMFRSWLNGAELQLKIQTFKNLREELNNLKKQGKKLDAEYFTELAKRRNLDADTDVKEQEKRERSANADILENDAKIYKETMLNPQRDPLDAYMLRANPVQYDRMIKLLERLSSSGTFGQKELEKFKTEEMWRRPISGSWSYATPYLNESGFWIVNPKTGKAIQYAPSQDSPFPSNGDPRYRRGY